MKIWEIISENVKPMGKAAKGAIPGLNTIPALDNNSNPYLAYRFGMALARSPANPIGATEGPIGSEFTMIDYSDADAEIRKGAEKEVGVKSSSKTAKSSTEMSHIQKQSPINKPKRNKYGV
jgi:hypothetical protein